MLQSAVKQSLHTYFPILNEAVSFSEFLQKNKDRQKFIAHCEEGREKSSLKSQLKPNSDVTVLIGPEGDFSLDEIKAALESGWAPVNLGDSRLRTETAAIVACHTVALLHEK